VAQGVHGLPPRALRNASGARRQAPGGRTRGGSASRELSRRLEA